MTIGENIKKYRTNLGMTQKQLADKVGMSEIGIRKYEGNERQPKIELLKEIACALETDINELIKENNLGIGYKIKRIRKDKNISREYLAEKLGVKPPTISRYENGTRELNVKTLNKIANILDISASELIEQESNNAININLGSNVKLYREKIGISQRELGRKINVTGQLIQKIESGQANPSIQTLNQISKELNISLDVLSGFKHNFETKRLEDYTTDELLAEIKRRIEND
jgi:transcriptional regulator with XRE-family HTH domain